MKLVALKLNVVVAAAVVFYYIDYIELLIFQLHSLLAVESCLNLIH